MNPRILLILLKVYLSRDDTSIWLSGEDRPRSTDLLNGQWHELEIWYESGWITMYVSKINKKYNQAISLF